MITYKSADNFEIHIHIILKTKTDIFELHIQFKDTMNPLQLFVEKCQLFNQNNQWINSIVNH